MYVNNIICLFPITSIYNIYSIQFIQVYIYLYLIVELQLGNNNISVDNSKIH